MFSNLQDEECFILFGYKWGPFWYGYPDKYTTGHPANVWFDGDYVWENRDKIVGFIHTHPNFIASPSSTDYQTMQATVLSLGKPLVCCIKGQDGLRAHWFMDDESDHIETRVVSFRKRLIGEVSNGK